MGSSAMEAPLLQSMTTDLEALPAVVIRQQSQWAEVIAQAFAVPYESVNKYKMAALPDDVQAAGSWMPTAAQLDALPELMRVEEASSLWGRIALTCLGWLHLRRLQLHFTERGAERLTAQRPFRLGGCCGCPLETTVMQEDAVLGEAVEDFGCVDNFCRCVYHTRVYEQQQSPGRELQHRFSLKTWLCCCGGRRNNCCGATCCNEELMIDVLDQQGQAVATIRKLYAPSSDCSAFCRMSSMFSNYVLEFPKEASAAQRALLMAALLHVDYQLFERKGGASDS